MGNKLYVGNLPYSATSESLEGYFTQVGTVSSAKVITDRESGRSKGFGFVEMASEDEAMNAIEKLNNSQFEGRAIRISEAKPMAPREDRGPRAPRGDRRPRNRE